MDKSFDLKLFKSLNLNGGDIESWVHHIEAEDSFQME